MLKKLKKVLSQADNYLLISVYQQTEECIYVQAKKNSKQFTIKMIPNCKVFANPVSKRNYLKEIKMASKFQNNKYFVNFIDYFYTQDYLILIFEDFYKYSLENISKKFNIKNWITLIFKDTVDIVWTLKNNKVVANSIKLSGLYMK